MENIQDRLREDIAQEREMEVSLAFVYKKRRCLISLCLELHCEPTTEGDPIINYCHILPAKVS